MKKYLLLLFAALLPMLASAQIKVEIDGIWYNLITKAKQAEVTSSGGTKYSGSITIPATVTYDGVTYSVTSIGDDAFYWCENLTAVTIPEGVTSIGEDAFYWCENLTAITISKGVTSIGEGAFWYCENLTAITVPEGSKLTSIGDEAFYWCENLTAITIPEGVTSIGEEAFYHCDNLTAVHIGSIDAWCKITFGDYYSNPLCYAHNLYLNGELVTELVIPESVTSIGEYAFNYCTSLTAITIPEGVTSIGEYAFNYCTSLTSITIPEGVTSIGSCAFFGCTSLTAINIPEGVTSIESFAFEDCSSLTAINIPEGVTSIGGSAFEGCSSLTAINIPEGVTSIWNYAFSNCTSLTTIVLPKSQISIGAKAFADCSELTDVYCYGELVNPAKEDAFEGSYIEYATLHVPASAIDDYKSSSPWSDFGNIVSLDAAITRITLSESSATLTEGETLVLTMTTTPEDADRNLITWSSSDPSVATVDNTGKVTAIAPGTTTITAMANDGSGVSALCEVTVNELILGTCATPTISYVDGKVMFACDTEEAIIKSNIKENIAGDYTEVEVAFIPTYTLTAYATKENYKKSDEVTLTLCWVPCKENHGDDNGILTIPSHPVLISTQGGTITLSGLAEGTEIAVYTTAGTEVATATATNGTATLTTGLEAGSIAIVKIGNYSIKVAIK